MNELYIYNICILYIYINIYISNLNLALLYGRS